MNLFRKFAGLFSGQEFRPNLKQLKLLLIWQPHHIIAHAFCSALEELKTTTHHVLSLLKLPATEPIVLQQTDQRQRVIALVTCASEEFQLAFKVMSWKTRYVALGGMS